MPILTVFAGPNGSGKSSLIASLRDQGIEFGAYYNADDIAAGLIGRPDEVARLAQEIVREKRAEALAESIDHSFETVMSHVSHIEYMRTARESGFEVRLFFVATDKPEINLGRVANRVAHGGHDVPQDRIISRYYRCLENLPSAIATSDSAWIFDNSQAGQPHRLLAYIEGGKGGILHHLGQELMDGELPIEAAYPIHVPAWWLRILLELKYDYTFPDGPIA
jgi:predicted ABC-type ATPase